MYGRGAPRDLRLENLKLILIPLGLVCKSGPPPPPPPAGGGAALVAEGVKHATRPSPPGVSTLPGTTVFKKQYKMITFGLEAGKTALLLRCG
jgi:hypothetical protein